MTNIKAPTAIYVLIGVLVAAIAGLAGAGVAIPTVLPYVLIALVAGGLGITVPGGVPPVAASSTTTTSTTNTPAPVAPVVPVSQP